MLARRSLFKRNDLAKYESQDEEETFRCPLEVLGLTSNEIFAGIFHGIGIISIHRMVRFASWSPADIRVAPRQTLNRLIDDRRSIMCLLFRIPNIQTAHI